MLLCLKLLTSEADFQSGTSILLTRSTFHDILTPIVLHPIVILHSFSVQNLTWQELMPLFNVMIMVKIVIGTFGVDSLIVIIASYNM